MFSILLTDVGEIPVLLLLRPLPPLQRPGPDPGGAPAWAQRARRAGGQTYLRHGPEVCPEPTLICQAEAANILGGN